MQVRLLQPVEVFLPVIERQDPPGEDFQLADAKDIQAGICHPWREARSDIRRAVARATSFCLGST